MLISQISLPSEREHSGWPALNDYVDNRLTSAERKTIDAHLASCDLCRHDLSDVTAVLTAARAERGMVTAPASLWPIVAAATIHSRVVSRHFAHSIRWPLLLSALALFLLGFGLATWAMSGCADRHHLANPSKCAGPWYRILRDGFEIRIKEVRKNQVRELKNTRTSVQHSF